jgi:hypothetical protein
MATGYDLRAEMGSEAELVLAFFFGFIFLLAWNLRCWRTNKKVF